ACLRAVISWRIAMYCSGFPSSPRNGTIVVLTQYREPSFARLQTSPCQMPPFWIVFHISLKKLFGWKFEFTMRCVFPINSSLVYWDSVQNFSLTYVMTPLASVMATTEE